MHMIIVTGLQIGGSCASWKFYDDQGPKAGYVDGGPEAGWLKHLF